MAMVLKGVQAFTRNKVEVRGTDGEVIDSFVVEWHTPSDEDALDIQQARYDVLKKVQAQREGSGELDADSLFDDIRRMRQQSAERIRQFFHGMPDSEEYEEGDLDRMLEHRVYVGALLESLYQVASGDADLGNSKKLGTSGQQASSQATQASKVSPKKKPKSSKGS